MKYTHKDTRVMLRPGSELADAVALASAVIPVMALRKEPGKLFYNTLFRLKGHRPIPVTFPEWLRPPRQLGTQVAKTSLREGRHSVTVSTIFLGINHAHDCGPPLVFETMVFGGKQDKRCCRYSTWRQAVAGHKAIVRELRRKPKILKRSSLRP